MKIAINIILAFLKSRQAGKKKTQQIRAYTFRQDKIFMHLMSCLKHFRGNFQLVNRGATRAFFWINGVRILCIVFYFPLFDYKTK